MTFKNNSIGESYQLILLPIFFIDIVIILIILISADSIVNEVRN